MSMSRGYSVLVLLFFINFFIWSYARPVQAIWVNVPPAPSYSSTVMSTLGDREMAYRAMGLMLQNLGDHGGKTRSLRDYNYSQLQGWLYLGDSLNQKSNYIPALSAYYYGGIKEPDKIKYLADFLSVVGQRPYDTKWRWLVWSMTQYQNKIGDRQKALTLSEKLQEISYPDKPDWTYRLKAMVYFNTGEKLKAYIKLRDTLRRYHDRIDASEEISILDFICYELYDFSKESLICTRFSGNESEIFVESGFDKGL